jgi:hypothetical protein
MNVVTTGSPGIDADIASIVAHIGIDLKFCSDEQRGCLLRGFNQFQIFMCCRRERIAGLAHNKDMKTNDVTCSACTAGLRRLELCSQPGRPGSIHCPLCDHAIELLDGSHAVTYRVIVAPRKLIS